jgi:uncharacterized alkaline shock family protein YloU/adenylate kinase family enzyme
MQIYGFYGHSGTGKSTRALSLSHSMKIPAMIDDGLLIVNGQKIAGTSAKYEKNKMKAIKRAIFHDLRHAEEVKSAITSLAIEKLMILGTSREMVLKIVKVLDLPEPLEWINIADIASPDDIRSALYTRRTEGKHVIPIPKIEVEKNLLSKWILKVQSIFSDDKRVIGESTVVFARFQLGRIFIHENCIKDIIHSSCRNIKGLVSINRVSVKKDDLASIVVHVTIKYGEKLPQIAHEIQYTIQQALEKMMLFAHHPPQIVVSHLSVEKTPSKRR